MRDHFHVRYIYIAPYIVLQFSVLLRAHFRASVGENFRPSTFHRPLIMLHVFFIIQWRLTAVLWLLYPTSLKEIHFLNILALSFPLRVLILNRVEILNIVLKSFEMLMLRVVVFEGILLLTCGYHHSWVLDQSIEEFSLDLHLTLFMILQFFYY